MFLKNRNASGQRAKKRKIEREDKNGVGGGGGQHIERWEKKERKGLRNFKDTLYCKSVKRERDRDRQTETETEKERKRERKREREENRGDNEKERGEYCQLFD